MSNRLMESFETFGGRVRGGTLVQQGADQPAGGLRISIVADHEPLVQPRQNRLLSTPSFVGTAQQLGQRCLP
ncbi:MAG: hypothetical protein AB7U73_15205, partial [Pirellulales bacterium]